MPALLWTQKYFPKAMEEFVGNSEIAEFAESWAKAWEKGKKQQPLLFYGQTGAGKTCLAYLIAKLHNFEVFELNASDFRDKETIERFVGAASQSASFSGKKRLILIDEVDGVEGTADRGGISAINSIIRESQNPVILTANDIYANRNLAMLRSSCKLLEFKKINYLSIAKRAREILDLEKIKYDEDAIKEMAKNSSGDFRSVLLDLQTLSVDGAITKENSSALGYRERTEKIYKVMMDIFKGKNFDDIRNARNSAEISDDLLLRWIEENIPRQYTHPEDTAAAFERLSRADIFNGRILNRQYWGFLRYSGDLATAGVALSRKHDYHGFTPFQFPTILSKLSSSMSVRALKKEMGRKIGKGTHASAREIISSDIPYLQLLMQDHNTAVSYAAQFDLDEKEIAFLLGTKPGTKKVQKIIEEAELLKQQMIFSKAHNSPLVFPEEAAKKAKSKKEKSISKKEKPSTKKQKEISGFASIPKKQNPEPEQKQTRLF